MTLLELLAVIATGGGSLGAGAAALLVGAQGRAVKRRSSEPPSEGTHAARHPPAAPPTPAHEEHPSGRWDVPFVSRDECHLRESGIDQRLARIEQKQDAYGAALSEQGRALARIEGRLDAKGAR